MNDTVDISLRQTGFATKNLERRKSSGTGTRLPPILKKSVFEPPQLQMGEIVTRRKSSPRVQANAPSKHVAENTRAKWGSTKLYTLVPQRLSFSPHESDEQTIEEIKKHPKLFFFSTDSQEQYFPFCKDFGPVNIATLVHFCKAIRARELDKRLANRHLVYYFTNNTESSSNAAFLLSAYLMLEHNFSVDDAVAPFNGLEGSPIAPFRDATYSEPTFALTLRDCLCGLQRAREQGWFDHRSFDLDEYAAMEDPKNGDVHRMCPKFVAFRGPDDRPQSGAAQHHPKRYIELFKELGVTTVVRLNDRETYDEHAFKTAGFRHCDLGYADCTTPSDGLVRKFLQECDSAEGMVAVHCLAGLGRTGTMIGLWLMSRCGFSAREAIAWLRIVRPGSVIGPQQEYLVSMEARLGDGSFPESQGGLIDTKTQSENGDDSSTNGEEEMEEGSVEARRLAASVASAMRRRTAEMCREG